MLRGNLLCSSSCTLFLILSLSTTEKSHPLWTPTLYLYTLRIFSLRLLLSGMNSTLSTTVLFYSQPFLLGDVLQSLHHLYDPVLDSSSILMSLLYRRTQIWTQPSRCGLSSDEEKGRIAFLHILAILCQLQIRMPLAFFASGAYCWISFTWCPTRTSRSVLQDCFISR